MVDSAFDYNTTFVGGQVMAQVDFEITRLRRSTSIESALHLPRCTVRP